MEMRNLREKVDELEKSLLAIDCLNNVCQGHLTDGMAPLENCASILNYLIEPAMYQVEAVRLMLEEMQGENEASQ